MGIGAPVRAPCTLSAEVARGGASISAKRRARACRAGPPTRPRRGARPAVLIRTPYSMGKPKQLALTDRMKLHSGVLYFDNRTAGAPNCTVFDSVGIFSSSAKICVPRLPFRPHIRVTAGYGYRTGRVGPSPKPPHPYSHSSTAGCRPSTAGSRPARRLSSAPFFLGVLFSSDRQS